jgi:peptidoglycan/LPS O-acetylase OafA/YrhL
VGVNRITRATPAYFLTIFMIAFGEIFLKYFWNIFEIKNILNFYLKNYNILLKVMFKI